MTTSTAFSIRTTGIGRRAFTLIELLVVVGMIALIMGAMTTSVSSAMQRARVQKATAEVKMLTQAILSYERYNKGKLDVTKGENGWQVADKVSLKYLLGQGDTPVLIQAALSSGGVMRDPWGMPYYIKIRKGTLRMPGASTSTGYYQQNFYRLTEDERK